LKQTIKYNVPVLILVDLVEKTPAGAYWILAESLEIEKNNKTSWLMIYENIDYNLSLADRNISKDTEAFSLLFESFCNVDLSMYLYDFFIHIDHSKLMIKKAIEFWAPRKIRIEEVEKLFRGSKAIESIKEIYKQQHRKRSLLGI